MDTKARHQVLLNLEELETISAALQISSGLCSNGEFTKIEQRKMLITIACRIEQIVEHIHHGTEMGWD